MAEAKPSRRATWSKVVSYINRNAADTECMETPEQKRKRQFDYMVSDVLKARKKHQLAAQYYSAWGNRVFIFSASITLLQALLATLAQAQIFTESSQSIFNISIALLSAFSVFWQSFAKHWDFSGKAGLHESTSAALGKIYNNAELRAREEQANAVVGDTGAAPKAGAGAFGTIDEDGGENKEEVAGQTEVDEIMDNLDDIQSDPNMFWTLTRQFEQATEGCTSQIPMKISAAFHILDAHIGACKRDRVSEEKSDEDEHKIRWEKIYPSLYSILTTTIISQRGWPYVLPDPEKVVKEAMDKFIAFDVNLLEALLKRNDKIDVLYRPSSQSGPKWPQLKKAAATEATPLLEESA